MIKKLKILAPISILLLLLSCGICQRRICINTCDTGDPCMSERYKNGIIYLQGVMKEKTEIIIKQEKTISEQKNKIKALKELENKTRKTKEKEIIKAIEKTIEMEKEIKEMTIAKEEALEKITQMEQRKSQNLLSFIRKIACFEHVVREGETLSKLANRYFQEFCAWPIIYISNPKIENPDLIYPGDRILIGTNCFDYINP